jgi:hypothetical protein
MLTSVYDRNIRRLICAAVVLHVRFFSGDACLPSDWFLHAVQLDHVNVRNLP